MDKIKELQELLIRLEELTLENNEEGMRETEHKILTMYLCK